MTVKYVSKKALRKKYDSKPLSKSLKKKASKKKAKAKVKKLSKLGSVKSSVILKDKNQVPLADPPINKDLLATHVTPPTGDLVYLEKEKLRSQIEILLLKGVVSFQHIAATLGASTVTVKRYVDQVYYRWAVLGGAPKMRQLKGEAKARLDLINNELWVLFSNTTDEKIKTACMAQLLNVHDRKMILEGLTQKMLPIIAQTETRETLPLTVADRIQDHQEMIRLSSALIEYAIKNSEDIEEGSYTPVETQH